MKNLKIVLGVSLGLLLAACQGKPKVIESEPLSTATTAPSGVDHLSLPEDASALHTVVVEEALNTARYTYLRVTENGENFWIAIPRREVEIGATYYYQGGLLKRNFQSQEFNRIFETLYLVSDIREQPMPTGGTALEEATAQTQASDAGPIEVTPAKGAIKISELVANKSAYEGKVVKVTGKCVKVNPMIMGRNWVHIRDGSANNYDLTITTTEIISLGAVVSLEGTIALNKDFGAGYRYDVIMEGAVLK